MFIKNTKKKLYTILAFIKQKARKIIVPGFDGIPLYDVGVFFKNGLLNGVIDIRASAISFSFFMAVFPSIIFIFTLIPFIPIPNFQNELINLLSQVLPSNTFKAIESTIVDITTNKRGSLLSIGFFAALIFSTNGISAMIAAFNASANSFENRSWISMRLIAIVLIFILVSLTTLATGLIVFGQNILKILVEHQIIRSQLSQIIFIAGQWLIILLSTFLALSFLYYFAPSKRSQYRFISPGSIMATVLMIITSMAFSFYINHFGRYNYLYGSIGTLIALLIWININAFVLLIGFELNISIQNAKLNHQNNLLLSENSMVYEKYYPKKDDIFKE